jgi:DNA sulfur modification protein DndD
VIFKSITVSNLFCYHGEQTLDLRRPEGTPPERNIALVIGRNGYGKTSLLNAVKLLFLGTEKKEQRKVGFPPTNLQRNEYILGKPGRWLGIRNLGALQDRSARFFVRVVMDMDGRETTIQREFIFDRNGRLEEETLLWQDDTGELFYDRPAQDRLDELLPAELVQFFFFDGEEIQQLAEAAEAGRQAAIERLLRLRFLTGVEEQVEELARAWLRAELPEEIRAAITTHETERLRLEAEAARLSAENDRLSMEQKQLLSDVDEKSRRMGSLREGASQADVTALEQEIATVSRNLEERQNAVATEVAADAPLLVSSGLIAAGITSIEELVERKAQSQNASLKELFAAIPSRLFDEPPHPIDPLREHVKQFYRQKLKGMLATAVIEDTGPPHLLDSLDLPRARALKESLTTIRAMWPTLRQKRAHDLREISRQIARLKTLRENLREAKFSQPHAIAELEYLQKGRDAANRRLGEISETLKVNNARLNRISSSVIDADGQIAKLENQINSARKSKRQLEITGALQRTLRNYRNIQKREKRESIEINLNKNFHKLMDGHGFVSKFVITEDFHMKLFTVEGHEIGLSTISHGMRQLAVTALFWALKDIADSHQIPIIVDTPLARIDKLNQFNLIYNYYPSAANQVVLLATDSEIDEEKYEKLECYIYHQSILSNRSGRGADFKTIFWPNFSDRREN